MVDRKPYWQVDRQRDGFSKNFELWDKHIKFLFFVAIPWPFVLPLLLTPVHAEICLNADAIPNRSGGCDWMGFHFRDQTMFLTVFIFLLPIVPLSLLVLVPFLGVFVISGRYSVVDTKRLFPHFLIGSVLVSGFFLGVGIAAVTTVFLATCKFGLQQFSSFITRKSN